MKKQLLFLSIMVLFNAAMAQVPSYVPTNGLVGWWPFNGNANDESGNGNTFNKFGNVFFDVDRFNVSKSSVLLDGNNSYLASNSSFLNTSSDFTISIWLKFKSFSSNGASTSDRCIFNTYPNANHAIELWSYNSSQTSIGNNSAGYIGNGSGWYKVPSGEYKMTLNIDSWYQWIIVKKNNVRKIFLSNKLIYQFSSSFNGPNSLTGIMFGSMCGGPTWPDWEFNGNLDDIAIWNRALDSNEIKLLYTGCTKSITQQPVNQGMFAGNATFTCNTDDTLVNYQWQINAGTGWNNLSDAGQFSGTTTKTLTVSNVISFNNNEKFRCIIKGDCLTDTTTEATLRVWGLGVTSEQTMLFKLYPNPSSEVLNISAASDRYTVSVYNSLGQEIYNKAFAQNNNSIEVKQWPAGVYHVEIKDVKNYTQIQKFIKQ